jgi:hypothetical protein
MTGFLTYSKEQKNIKKIRKTGIVCIKEKLNLSVKMQN